MENIIQVVANSGCQDFFFPLFPDNAQGSAKLVEGLLWYPAPEQNGYVKNFEEWQGILDDTAREELLESAKEQIWKTVQDLSYIRYHIVRRVFSSTLDVIGIEISVETNTERGKGGYFWHSEIVSENDSRQAKINKKTGKFDTEELRNPYNQVKPGKWVLDRIPQAAEDPNNGISASPEGGIRIKLCEDVNFEFFVNFKNPKNPEPCNVDLIIDFGNSRTMALLLNEDAIRTDDGAANINRIRQHCNPVLLKLSEAKAVSKNDLKDVDNGVVSSWFVLHETRYKMPGKRNEPYLFCREWKTEPVRCGFLGLKTEYRLSREDQRVPNMFVQVSPVLLGDEAADVLHDSMVTNRLIKQGAMLQQSSPKRYFWDTNRTKTSWNMVPNFIPQVMGSLPTLESDLLYWMDEDGEFVDRDDPNTPLEQKPLRAPKNPQYPRSATFVWMFVAILEKAWKQCNGYSLGMKTFEQFILKNVVVTFPSGWTGDELEQYRNLCQAAINIFKKSHFGSDKDIQLDMDLDEAVASQLPYVFSEIHEFGDNAEGWMRFAGKKRGEEENLSVRILNLDVGGGTSDISLIEYSDLDETEGVELQPRILYKNGFAFAGDEILRRIIQDVVLPNIAELCSNENKSKDDLLEDLKIEFSRASGDTTFDINRGRVVRQCLMPIAFAIMTDLRRPGSDMTKLRQEMGEMITTDQWDTDFREEFLKDLDGMPSLDTILNGFSYEKSAVNEIIHEAFIDIFELLAELTAKYDADLFFMSGKPSELPELKNLALKYIPLCQNRIISAKDYRAGDWYPFANEKENTIKDAKSVTAVGAALYHILSSEDSLVNNWMIRPTELRLEEKFQWGLLNQMTNSLVQFDFDDEGKAFAKVPNKKIIAKRLSEGTRADAVYMFCRKSGSNNNTGHAGRNYTVEFERVEKDRTERLKLISVTDSTGANVTGDFELTLCQQQTNGEVFWQDTGRILW